jgi:hypothetical protein
MKTHGPPRFRIFRIALGERRELLPFCARVACALAHACGLRVTPMISRAVIETQGDDHYVRLDGQRIARRGRSDTAEASTWVALVQGYKVTGTVLGPDPLKIRKDFRTRIRSFIRRITP